MNAAGAVVRHPAWWLFALAVAIHAFWATRVPDPMDWDPAYYRSVARHIADGDGAVIGALWTLTWVPERLPYVADLHWMPLPSRVLVPGVMLWRAHGDQLVTVLLGATWAPLAWALARRLGAGERASLVAGALAATGLCYARFLSTPDSIALYGAIGGLAFLAVADGRVGLAAGLGALAALTRNDGFLLAPCLALGLVGPGRWLVAASGPAVAALWHLRNHVAIGDAYWAARAATANVLDSENLATLATGDVEPLTLGDRLAFLAGEGLATALVVWLIALPLPAIGALARRDRWLRPWQAYFVLMPFVTQFLAPGVGSSGSVFRSGAALFPLACAACVVTLASVGAWTHRKRGYHPAFVPGLLLVAVFGLAYGLVLAQVNNLKNPLGPDVCALLAEVPRGEPVFSVHPLLLEAHCDRPAIVLVEGMRPEDLRALAERFDVRYALAAPDDETYAPAAEEADLAELLPGWQKVSPRLFRAPEPR